jgi:hypothetical protein
MQRTTRPKGLGHLLATGVMMAAAIATSACGVASSDYEATLCEQYLRVVDELLTRGDVSAAALARQQAYLAALGSRRWDTMAAVGDATVRFMDLPGVGPSMGPEARRIYRSALFRARHQGSVEGVLRVSEAFADLGDRDVAREGLTMAADMPVVSYKASDAERLKALADRLDHVASGPEGSIEGARPPDAATVTWTR